MKAVFPVNGLGTRFLPATKAMPKEMLPVVDKPLIQYAVEEAAAAGITEMIFVTGRTKRAIEDHFDNRPELERELEEKGKKELNELISWLASGNDDRKSPSYCLGARGGVLIMLSLFTRYAEPIDSESTVLSSDDKVMERIGKVFELVGSSYDKDITLSAAADELRLPAKV